MTKTSAAWDNFRVYSARPFPPVLFEEAHKSYRHSAPSWFPLANSPTTVPPLFKPDWTDDDVL